MPAAVVVDCELMNGRGYVVMADASEFEIVMDAAGLHVRPASSPQELDDAAIYDAVHRYLVRERLLSS